jgi:hypothetical protein
MDDGDALPVRKKISKALGKKIEKINNRTKSSNYKQIEKISKKDRARDYQLDTGIPLKKLRPKKINRK